MKRVTSAQRPSRSAAASKNNAASAIAKRAIAASRTKRGAPTLNLKDNFIDSPKDKAKEEGKRKGKVSPAAAKDGPAKSSRRKVGTPALLKANDGSPTVPMATPFNGPTGKLGRLVALLRDPGGATLPAMMRATGWQAHSVRGAMAGALKKKLSLSIISEKPGTTRIWRIVEDRT